MLVEEKSSHILSIMWLCYILSIVFISSRRFIDADLTPKWLFFIIATLVFILFYSLQYIKSSKVPQISTNVNYTAWAIEITLTSLAIIGISQFAIHHKFICVTGTYANSAGYAATLCSGFPYVLYRISCDSKNRPLHVLASTVIICGLLVSGSRTGLLCICFLLFAWWAKTPGENKHYEVLAAIVLIICICLVLFIVKHKSTSGRLLVWTCTGEMITDKWLYGWGTGGFAAHYMEYQSAYFQANPKSEYAFLADDIQHPFNEFLFIGVNYGIIGIISVIAFLLFIFHEYHKKHTQTKFVALLSMLAIIIFSLFSYPLLYPFTWFLLIINLFILLQDVPNLLRSYSQKNFFACLLSLSAIFCLCETLRFAKAEIEWAKVASSKEDKISIEHQYDVLYETLRSNRYFLYNYAYVLYDNENYNKSHSIALQCKEIWADYDLQILLGLLEMKLTNYDEALIYFNDACHMCPNRFRPLYLIMKVNEIKGNKAEVLAIAHKIMTKEIKVVSHEVLEIREYAKKYINNIQRLTP